ncbi:MAG: aminotransferase class I/II-fold pyridoxal phosphate-dependent enzyme, partial [Pseudonocardiaceae bacterium]
MVLAAGLGSRLGSQDRPKPLILVNGTPILHRALSNLASVGVREVVIVIGHRAAEISAAVGERFAGMAISYVVSDRFRTTNNAYSLWLARHHLNEDLFLVEGDVVFDAEILTQMRAVDAVAVAAISPWKSGMNGTVARVDANRRVSQLLLAAEQKGAPGMSRMFKTVNIHLLREPYLQAEFVPLLEDLIASGGDGEYYERVLAQSVQRRRFTVHGLDCRDLRWYEVDDGSDLVAAEYLFGSVDDRLDILRNMHGGYWRHDVVDHCLLYNPYFPTPALMEALMAEFGDTLVHYPVGHTTLQVLLATMVNQPPERLVIANGASELIKVLGRVLRGVVLAVPGFNEYEEVFDDAEVQRIEVLPPTFRPEIDDFHRAAICAKAQAVIVASPNNPTSVAVPREDLLRLGKLLAESGTLLVVDESFVDFCTGGVSLERDLSDHPNLVVVKSMSKAYGVGGLRLGYLATADRELASTIRAELPIWNVNGFAEAFL